MPGPKFNPLSLRKYDIGFRPNLVALDTSAISAAESYIYGLEQQITSNAESHISGAEDTRQSLSKIYIATHHPVVSSAESHIQDNLASLQATLLQDQQELDVLEQWLLSLPQGAIPQYPQQAGGLPQWMQPLDGTLPDYQFNVGGGIPQIPDIGSHPPGVQNEPIPAAVPMPEGMPSILPAMPGALPAIPVQLGRPGTVAIPERGQGRPASPTMAPAGPQSGSVPRMVPSGSPVPLGSPSGVVGTPGVPGGIPGYPGTQSPILGVPGGIPGGMSSSPIAGNPVEQGSALVSGDDLSGGDAFAGGVAVPVQAQQQPIQVTCKCQCCPCECGEQSPAPKTAKSIASNLFSSPVTNNLNENVEISGTSSVAEITENSTTQEFQSSPQGQYLGTMPTASGSNAKPDTTVASKPEATGPIYAPTENASEGEVDLKKLLEEQPSNVAPPSAPPLVQSAYEKTALQLPEPQGFQCSQWEYKPEWTERFLAGRNWLIKFGDMLLRGGKDDTDFTNISRELTGEMLASLNNRKDLAEALLQYTKQAETGPLFNELLRCWVKSSHEGWCNKKDHLAQLYAAQHFLRMMDDWALHIGLGDTYSDSVHMSLGGELGGNAGKQNQLGGPGSTAGGTGGASTGAGVGHNRHKAYEWRLGTAIHFATVPLLHIVEYAIRYDEQIEPIDAESALQLFMRGFIPREQAEVIIRARGHDFEQFVKRGSLEQEYATADDLIQYARRTGKDGKWIASRLQKIGWVDTEQQEIINTLYDELPTISEHLHWLQRNVGNKDYVETFKLGEGFEENFWKEYGHDLLAQGVPKRTAFFHYCAHWLVPPQEQLARLMQRLRPGRVPDDVTVTKEMYLKALAEQDVAPFWRERFYEAAFRPLQLRFIRQLFFDGQISEAEVSRLYQDIGYKSTDAHKLAASEAQRKARTRAINGHGFSVPQLRKYYVAGYLTRDEVAQHMVPQGYTEEEVDELIATAKLDQQIAIRRIKIQAIMASYKSGATNVVQLRSQLSRLHLPPDQVSALVELAEAKGQKDKAAEQSTAEEREAIKSARGDADKIRAAELLIHSLTAEMHATKRGARKKRLQDLIRELQGQMQFYDTAPIQPPEVPRSSNLSQ